MKLYRIFLLCLITFGMNGVAVAENVGDVSKGKALAQVCVACHGADGNSVNPVWPKIAGQHASYIVKQLQDYKSGVRANVQMAGIVASLSEEDMRHLGAYFASQKTKIGSADPQYVELGQRIYRAGDPQAGIAACMACHAPDGSGNPSALYPALSGQYAEYTAMQLKMFKAEERKNEVMRSITSRMTNAQIKAVSEYIQGLH